MEKAKIKKIKNTKLHLHVASRLRQQIMAQVITYSLNVKMHWSGQ